MVIAFQLCELCRPVTNYIRNICSLRRLCPVFQDPVIDGSDLDGAGLQHAVVDANGLRLTGFSYLEKVLLVLSRDECTSDWFKLG